MKTITALTHHAAIREILTALGYAESGSIQAQLAMCQVKVEESDARLATVYTHPDTDVSVEVQY